MYISIDLIPKSGFFISVALSETQLLSFDNTLGNQRVIKQALVRRVSAKATKTTHRYKTLEAVNGKFRRVTKSVYVRAKGLDVVNGQAWRIVWRGKMDGRVSNRLSKISRDIYKNLGNKKNLEPVLMRLDGYLFALISAQKR